MDCYAGHGRCPTRFRLLLFSVLIPFPFPLSTLFFFSLLCVASRHTKTAVTSPPVDRCWFATRSGRASPRRANANSNSFFFVARATRVYSVPVLRPPTVHRPASAYCTDAAVTRSHHLPHGPDRAHRVFRARNRRASLAKKS